MVVVNDVAQAPGAAAPGEGVVPSALRGGFAAVGLEVALADMNGGGDADAGGLCEQADAGVVMLVGSVGAVGVVHDVDGYAGFALRDHVGGDGAAEHGDLGLQDGVDVGAYGVNEWGQNHARAVGAGLVHIQQDVGAPDVEAALYRKAGFALGEHEPVAVVVVAGVFVIQERGHNALVVFADCAFVPALDMDKAVGVEAGD